MNLAKAKEFVVRWRGRGNEKSETAKFWMEFAQMVLEVADPYDLLCFEKPVKVSGAYNGSKVKKVVPSEQSQMDFGCKPSKRKSTQKFIDVYIPSAKVIIEQKSLGVSLDASELQSDGSWLTPLEQALRYNSGLRPSEQARYVITCNFSEFRFYDLEYQDDLFQGKHETVFLEDLDKNLPVFDILVRTHEEELRKERELSIEAARLMARLRDELEEEYALFELNRDDLTVLMVRLLFCMYAEDAALFEPNQFRDLLKDETPDQETAEFVETLSKLFEVLNTPMESRKRTLAGKYSAFPYVNGGLFADEIDIPFFTEESKAILLDECCPFQWSQISPALFGALFESVLSPEQRHDGGMHYTSIENIRRVTRPLFLDGLELALRKAGNSKGKLLDLQKQISNLKILDPACGSGNFLTQTYVDLRRIENEILDRLVDPNGTGQGALLVDEKYSPKISIGSFYGIEINDFAVHVTEAAMQIAKHQMDVKTSVVLNRSIDTLPLTKDTSIVEANALRIDWNDILPAEECSYVLGNPPFLGARNQSKVQKEELQDVLKRTKNSGNVDYVAGWFHKAADYVADNPIRCGFVATNSVCQGEQVANVWKPLWDRGFRIDFAHDTFRWESEAASQAHVFVVIVGFSRLGGPKRLFHHPNPDAEATELQVGNLNAYLADGPDCFIWNRSKPICLVPEMGIGNKPIDDGNYLFDAEECKTFLAEEPGAKEFIHPWVGSKEFINGKNRFVLWLGDATPEQLISMPKCYERVLAVREFRLRSKSSGTRKLAETPTQFHVQNIPTGASILIPQTSSSSRQYIPMGFIGPGTLCSNAVRLIPNSSLYVFGVLQSRVHNAWVRRTTGRLKDDYQYAARVVYNNFPWPGVSKSKLDVPVEQAIPEDVKSKIEQAAQAVLDARREEMEKGRTIADLYSPVKFFMYKNLMAAHKRLDAEVEKAYGFIPGSEEVEIVNRLFDLYSKLVD